LQPGVDHHRGDLAAALGRGEGYEEGEVASVDMVT
jgi:hypothetical protein